MSSQVRKILIIKGDVQGVGYRWFATRAAMKHEVSGYVMNLPDGNVEVVLEGEEGMVSDCIKELRTGPPHASISGVEVTDGEYTGEFLNFGVKYY